MPKLRYTKPKVAMVVDTREGKILGWQRGDLFVPFGENCCENPLCCKALLRPRKALVGAVVAMSESASTRSHHPRERLVDDLELVLGRRGVGVPRRVGGPDLELVLALVQVLHLRRRGAALPRLLVLLALERRALLVGAKLELDLGLLGLIRRALDDLRLGRVGVRGASAASSAASGTCGRRGKRRGPCCLCGSPGSAQKRLAERHSGCPAHSPVSSALKTRELRPRP